jgi:hypothetical protein
MAQCTHLQQGGIPARFRHWTKPEREKQRYPPQRCPRAPVASGLCEEHALQELGQLARRSKVIVQGLERLNRRRKATTR